LLKEGDLVIEKSGGSPTQSTGRVVYISKDLIENIGSIVCSNFCTAIRVKPEWNPLYVYYYWQNIYNRGVFFNFEGKTSGIKNLQLDNALSSIEIEYLPLEKQNKIVVILSAIDSKIAINRQINDNLPIFVRSLVEAITHHVV
jgi:type I restriction enzyme S subunit